MNIDSFNDGIEFKLLTNIIEHHHNMLTGSLNPDDLRQSLLPILKVNYDRAMFLGEKYCVDRQELGRLSRLYACCVDSTFSEYAATQRQTHTELSRNG